MPFYSRRTIQKIIDENRLFIPEDATKNIIGKLNSGRIDSLPFYWEVFILNLLSKIGEISHEKNHGGSTNPDVTFFNKKIEFQADITTVSDSDQEKNNDYYYFVSELNSFATARGLKYLNGFNIRVSGAINGDKRSRKAKIFLPPKNSTLAFIKEYLSDFIDNIVNDTKSSHDINIQAMGAQISINYNPSRKYTSGGFLDYTSIYCIDKNPIYNSLMNKHNQLKKSGYAGKKGVFICDGDCKVLRERYKSGLTNFSLSEIVQHFLSKKDKLDFIVIMYITHSQNHLSRKNSYSFEYKIFYAKKEMASFCEELDTELKQALSMFPPPLRTVKNSLNLLKYNKFIPSPNKSGAYKMSGGKITLSLRAVLELMSGATNQADFIDSHKYVINELTYQLDSGKLPVSIEISKEDLDDDDWLIIDFNKDTDPSISKFN